MYGKADSHSPIFGAGWGPTSAALTILLTILFLIFLLLFMNLTALPAQGQTYRVLYNLGTFDGAGMFPFAGVTIDRAGNLYITAKEGGQYSDAGCVFMLSPNANGWVYSPVYDFRGGYDGANPYDRVVFGPDGNLYGATAGGGGAGYCSGFGGCGTVFKLSKREGTWQETQLYVFQGNNDGVWPYSGDLVFDQAGSMYGTTEQGGYQQGNCTNEGCGIVYKLVPSGGGYAESVLYRFTAGSDGAWPYSGITFDANGNMFGTAGYTIYELSPSGSGWTENTLYTYQGARNGSWPFGGVIFDHLGNLFGTTVWGGAGNNGTVYELSPSNGSWSYKLLYSFVTFNYAGGNGPYSDLTMDAAGNLYGTSGGGGRYGWGSVFKLTRSGSGWTYTSLYDFCRGGRPCNDGASPLGPVTFDENGNLYGTTYYGGSNWGGVVWEITP